MEVLTKIETNVCVDIWRQYLMPPMHPIVSVINIKLMIRCPPSESVDVEATLCVCHVVRACVCVSPLDSCTHPHTYSNNC